MTVEILLGWGMLLLVLAVLGLVIRAAGPAEKPRPHCGAEQDRSGRGSGGCH